MMLLLESTLRVSLVLLAALAAAALMRRRSAAARHWILAMAIISAVLMPALAAVAPQWEIPRHSVQALIDRAPATTQASEWLPSASTSVNGVPADSLLDGSALALWMWMAGAFVGVVLLAAGFARLAWMASRCEPVVDRRWLDALREIAAQLDVRRDVALLQSSHPSLLVTWGLWAPKVLLPENAMTWSDDRVRIVLGHELSHVRRGDWTLQMLGGALRAIYWFNPLVWLACRRLRDESERACDDDVIGLGTTGTEYASELLNIARTLRRPAWSPAPCMARPSSLQRRIRAMLNTTIDRRPMSGGMRVSIAAVMLSATFAIAGSGAAAQVAGAALSGSFVDALNNAVPGVTLTLKEIRTGDVYSVTSDARGQFTFAALPDGDYQSEVAAVGFASIHPFFRIKDGQSTQPTTIALPLGTVEETVTVSEDRARSAWTENTLPERIAAFRDKMKSAPLAPPLKTRNVYPLFPPSRGGTEATVFLQGVIGGDGYVKGLQVIEPADVEFARAAFDAVQDWQFEPTRLHGAPVDTSIRVSVRFVR